MDTDLDIIPGAQGSNDEIIHRAADWFQCHYQDLQTEFDAEQDEWSEEMEHLHSSSPYTQQGA